MENFKKSEAFEKGDNQSSALRGNGYWDVIEKEIIEEMGDDYLKLKKYVEEMGLNSSEERKYLTRSVFLWKELKNNNPLSKVLRSTDNNDEKAKENVIENKEIDNISYGKKDLDRIIEEMGDEYEVLETEVMSMNIDEDKKLRYLKRGLILRNENKNLSMDKLLDCLHEELKAEKEGNVNKNSKITFVN